MVKIKSNISVARLSTFKSGNKAKYCCEVKNDTELLEAIIKAKELKALYKIIAGGSNVLFPDTVLNCLLIRVRSKRLKVEGNKIVVDAGTLLSRVIAQANKHGLRGLETLAGIPGTVGGAIVGNAGAYGHSISEAVEEIEILDGGTKRWLKNKDCRFHYRESIFKEGPYIVLRAVLKFKKSNPDKLEKISNNIIKIRLKKYKPGLRCPGSFFKNVLVAEAPKKSLALIDQNKIIDGKIPAGYLLEEVAAKGMRCGGIQIADFHGNLFINGGSAKAADVQKLARILKNRVKKKFRIILNEEIRYF